MHILKCPKKIKRRFRINGREMLYQGRDFRFSRKHQCVEAGNTDVDPFAELEGELDAVEDLAKETSGSNAVSLRETVAGCFDPPVCQELPDNWEDSYFHQVGQEQTTIEHGDGNGASDDEVQ